jgi:uncharacterized damage-inducible protein DinB
MDAETLNLLVEFNQWANNRIYRKVAHLDPERLSEPNWLSGGNLRRTLFHQIDSQWFWRVGCQAGQFPAEELEETDFLEVRVLRKLSQDEDQALLDFAASLTSEELKRPVTIKLPRARPRQRILWYILQHVLNHNTHHRAEIGQYLATIGASPGDMDFVRFVGK